MSACEHDAAEVLLYVVRTWPELLHLRKFDKKYNVCAHCHVVVDVAVVVTVVVALL